MVLKSVHDSLEDIPENYRELYTEKNGKFELTGIQGVKTQADIDRVQATLENERKEHKATREKFSVWNDLEYEDVIQKLDRMPELEAAAADKLDDAKIEELASKRVEGTLQSRLRPVEREANQLREQNSQLQEKIQALETEKTNRVIKEACVSAMTKSKMLSEYFEDGVMHSERIFELNDDGVPVTRDNVGVTPGLTHDQWIEEMQEKRPGWWAPPQGGGARGSTGGSGAFTGKNPWSHQHWNKTEQARIAREKGNEYAENLAQRAGTTRMGMRPAAPKPTG